MLKRVASARTRLRDSAAADLAAAEGDRLEHERRLAASRRRHERAISRSAVQIAEAGDVRDLERSRDEIAGADDDVRRATTEVTASRMRSRLAADALRLKERELRISSRALERSRAERDRALARAEQRQSDELFAARWRRN